MPEVRIQVSLHFNFDPTRDKLDIPDEIIKTITVGDDITPTKVPSSAIGGETRTHIIKKLEDLVIAAKKTAKPVKKEVKPEAAKEEGDTGSLFGGEA